MSDRNHDTLFGWCCACEGDVAFAFSWLTKYYPEYLSEEFKKDPESALEAIYKESEAQYGEILKDLQPPFPTKSGKKVK